MSQSKGIGPLIKNRLFAGVNPQAIKLNITQSNFLSFKEGDIIFQTGDKSEYIYLIVDGEIKLKIVNSINHSSKQIKIKDEFFGELELFDSIPRKSSAVANTDSTVYKISQKDFFTLVSTNKQINETVSAGKDGNSTFIQDSPFLIKQDLAVFNETNSNAQDPESEIIPNTDNSLEEITPSQNSDNPIEEIPEFESAQAEEVPNIQDNELPVVDNDEDILEANMFSAALDGDLTFQDATVPESLPPVEESKASELSESQPQEVQQHIPETPEIEIDYKKIFYVLRKIYENVELDKTIHSIIEVVTSLLNAQAARIYILDKSNNELWSIPFSDISDEIKKVKIGRGLIGMCAGANETINISEPEQDLRFNFQVDKITNVTADDMLLFPVHDKDRNVAAVIQVINSSKNGFTHQDEELLGLLSADIYIALERSLQAPKEVRVEHSNQLENITGFIIEDISTPLTLIKRYSEFIGKKTSVREIKQVSEFITDQVNSVLTYSGLVSDFVHDKNSLKKTPIDLQEAMSNILDMFAEYVESRNTKLFKKLDTGIIIMMDVNAFYHACFQLIKNLCNAMPGGGNIYVVTQKLDNTASIEFRFTGLNTAHKSNSADAGPAKLPVVAGEGLSIGIANKIIKDHGGEIKMGSELTEDNSFIICLPIHSLIKD